MAPPRLIPLGGAFAVAALVLTACEPPPAQRTRAARQAAAPPHHSTAPAAAAPPAPTDTSSVGRIEADLALEWDEPVSQVAISVDSADLNGDGAAEFLVNGFCGSGGECVGYAYARSPGGGVRQLLGAITDESGLRPGTGRRHGWRDLVSNFAPDGVPQGRAVYHFDGRVYTPRGIPQVRPAGVVLADLDGDGALDLAVAAGPGWVTVLRGDGRGGFGAERRFAHRGRLSTALLAADLDRDGTLDLAVTNQITGDVAVLRGDGGGGFAPAQRFATGGDPDQLAVADVDSDGWSDLVVGNYSDDWLSIFHGSPAGLRAEAKQPVYMTRGLAAGDLDHDGDVDVAVSTEYAVQTLLGDGHGHFAPADSITLPGGGWYGAVGLADLDADGWLDLVAAYSDSRGAAVFLNRRGRLGLAGRVPQVRTKDLQLADLDGDAHPDLVALGPGNHATILRGLGGARFRVVQTLATGRGPGAVAIGDVNGDGRADLAVTCFHSDEVYLFLGRGDATFRLHRVILLDRPAR